MNWNENECIRKNPFLTDHFRGEFFQWKELKVAQPNSNRMKKRSVKQRKANKNK